MMTLTIRPVRTMWRGLWASFRKRTTEWMSGAALLLWAWILFTHMDSTAGNSFYWRLQVIMPLACWGWLAIAGGGARLTALILNGAWGGSAYARIAGSFIGFWVWGTIIVGVWWSDVSLGLAAYALAAAIDLRFLIENVMEATPPKRGASDGE